MIAVKAAGNICYKNSEKFYCHSSLFYRERVDEVPTDEIIEHGDTNFG